MAKKRMVTAAALVGKTIVAFDPGRWVDAAGKVAHNPTITLSDGSRLYFVVEETDPGWEYGVRIGRAVR